MRDRLVYIAGPYTHPDPVLNIRAAVEAAEEILCRTTRWLPFVPHLDHLWHLINPHAYEFWIGLNEDWLHACHAVVRIGQESSGADRELFNAAEWGVPVFMGVDEFIQATIDWRD